MSRIAELETVCAELYQVLGALAEQAGCFDHPDVQRALDNAAATKLVHRDLLPWPRADLTLEFAAEMGQLRTACEGLGPWMSAALDDPQVCLEMKDAIKAWFSALEETEKAERAEFERQMTIARRIMKKDRNALRELAKR